MTRLLLGLIVLAQLFLLAPAVSAQTPPPETVPQRVEIRWEPTRVTTQLVGGCAPNAPCPLERGVTYSVTVRMIPNISAEPMVIELEAGGLEIEAFGPQFDSTNALVAGQAQEITIELTIPEARGRNDRTFFLARLRLVGNDTVSVLPIAVNVPLPRVTWGQVMNPETGDRGPTETRIGSGGTLTRTVKLSSNFDAEDLELNANSDRVSLIGVPDSLKAGEAREITIEYDAPIVNRKTKTDIIVRPSSGLQALQNTLRIRLTVLPVQISWNPPFIRKKLVLQDQTPVPVTVFMTSNYDVPGVRFKTADLGLTPILSPTNPVDLKAGQPQPVQLNVCPGYAPTQYFLGITAYQGDKPLNKRLQIRVLVEDDGTGELPVDAPPCQTQAG